jgi:hypothetical protein
VAFLTGPISPLLLLSEKAENSISKSCVFYSATEDIVQTFSHFVAMCKRHKILLHCV